MIRGITIINQPFRKCKFSKVYLVLGKYLCEMFKISVKMILNFDKRNFNVGKHLTINSSIVGLLNFNISIPSKGEKILPKRENTLGNLMITEG